MLKHKNILFLLFVLTFLNGSAQLLINFDHNRNITYLNVSSLGKVFNSTLGIARKDSIKSLKTVITGFLDFTSPISIEHYNKLLIKKGFQATLFKKKHFLFPFTLYSTSIIRQNKMERRHDITSALDILPTYKFKNFYISLNLGAEIILFSHVKSISSDNEIFPHWEKPNTIIPKLGINFTLNKKHFVYTLKYNFEKNPYIKNDTRNHHNGYSSIGFGIGYKFQNKAF